MRKYEIHLPLSYSDGEPIEQEKLRVIGGELVAAFGSFVVPNRRAWRYDGVKFVEIMKIEILTTDERVPTRFLKAFKERLKQSLRRPDILITTHRIQTA
jgi:hypothetical protein